jgi:hypothetical protein
MQQHHFGQRKYFAGSQTKLNRTIVFMTAGEKRPIRNIKSIINGLHQCAIRRTIQNDNKTQEEMLSTCHFNSKRLETL